MHLKFSHFLRRPQDFGGLLIIAIAWSLAKLPLNAQLKLASGLGKLFYSLASKRRQVAKINLELCFPEKSEQQRDEILRDNFRQTALALIEVAACWFSDIRSRKQYSEIIGTEKLDAALAEGKGVLLLIFHFTSMELGGCLLGAHYDFNAMYKPTRNELVEQVMQQGRLRHIHALLTQDDVKGMVKALKRNEIVWYSTDQNYGNKAGIFAPFFGVQAASITALSRFARMTGAKVVPFTHKRIQGDRGLQLELHSAFDNFPSDDPVADALRVNHFLEDFLRKEPENYMWVHQRFRTRPPGEPPIYPKRKS